MNYCPNCGTEIDESVRFCPTCGKETAPAGKAVPVFDQQDIQDNKILAMLGYLSVGILPMVGCRNSAYAMHHVNQALWLFIGEMLCALLCILPILGWILCCVGEIVLLVFTIMGIVRALKGNGAYLPFVEKLPVIIK